jgi:hypothetical protein
MSIGKMMLRAPKQNIVKLKEAVHIDGPRVAYLIQRDNDGRIWVDYDGNPDGPLVAQLCATACDRLASLSDFTDIRVLVVFEDNQGDRPVILDVLHNDLNGFVKETCLSTSNKSDITMMDAVIDGFPPRMRFFESGLGRTGRGEKAKMSHFETIPGNLAVISGYKGIRDGFSTHPHSRPESSGSFHRRGGHVPLSQQMSGDQQ